MNHETIGPHSMIRTPYTGPSGGRVMAHVYGSTPVRAAVQQSEASELVSGGPRESISLGTIVLSGLRFWVIIENPSDKPADVHWHVEGA